MKGRILFLLIVCSQFFVFDVFASASCQSGYSVAAHIEQSTFASPVGGVCQFNGYELKEIPDDFAPIYNGFIVGSAITLCDGVYSSGCTSNYAQGVCESNNYATGAVQSTFSAPVSGICQFSGYSIKEIPDDLTPVYNGFISGSAITLCDGHMSGGSCVSNSPVDGSGNCISGYYDMGINANTFADLTNGSCSSPYARFTNTTRCDHNPGETCVDLPTPVKNLIWTDGENTLMTNTCVFEEGIVLPETPSKPGYVFTGWKLATE